MRKAQAIGVVVLIGRQHGGRSGTNGMMSWMVRARAAQTYRHGVAVAPARMDAEVSPVTRCQRQQQTQQHSGKQDSCDGLHVQAIDLPRMGED